MTLPAASDHQVIVAGRHELTSGEIKELTMDVGEENPKRSDKMRSDYAEYCRQGARLHRAAGLGPFSPKTYEEWSARYAGDYDWCEPD